MITVVSDGTGTGLKERSRVPAVLQRKRLLGMQSQEEATDGKYTLMNALKDVDLEGGGTKNGTNYTKRIEDHHVAGLNTWMRIHEKGEARWLLTGKRNGLLLNMTSLSEHHHARPIAGDNHHSILMIVVRPLATVMTNVDHPLPRNIAKLSGTGIPSPWSRNGRRTTVRCALGVNEALDVLYGWRNPVIALKKSHHHPRPRGPSNGERQDSQSDLRNAVRL